MLSHEDNVLLTRIEGEAPMGRMLRDCFWVPAVRAARLEPDMPPIRVRLFGENYIAWRAADGRVAFMSEYCPHRRASLLLARNEGCALRCIFHGWKIDVSGQVLETPNEARNPQAFAAKVKAKTYPIRETGGMIWVYLGAWDIPPKFPDFEFTSLPASHVNITSSVIPCNWVQGVEASLDDAHVGILHESFMSRYPEGSMTLYQGPPPTYDVALKPYGFEAAAIRELDDGRSSAAMTHFAMPWYGFVSSSSDPTGTTTRVVFIAVPIDDVTLHQWFLKYDIKAPIGTFIGGTVDHDPDDVAPPMGGAENRWGQDREAMRQGHFTGFTVNLLAEDTAVQMSMGPITDRTQEHLCSSDKAVGFARQVLLKAARDYASGQLPEAARPEVQWSDIRAWTREVGPGEDWRKAG